MADSILFVDDEPNILAALQRQFLDEPVSVLTASNALTALDILVSKPVSVITSDNMMPGMSGIELLTRTREVSPKTVRILLTAHADANAAIQAINAGEVYKFITKPWEPDHLRAVIRDALERHRVVASMRRADESTLRSLAQTIELKDPYTRGHCDRVADYAVRIAAALGLSSEKQLHIKYGSWLHDCGKIGVPEAILNLTGALNPEQMAVIRNHPRWGADVAKLAQLPETTVNVILHHHERFDGTGYPSGLKGDLIPIEARIVTVSDTYDAMTTDRPYQKGTPPEQSLRIMSGLKGSLFDPAVADKFFELLGTIKEKI